jgi:hypothetical protein
MIVVTFGCNHLTTTVQLRCVRVCCVLRRICSGATSNECAEGGLSVFLARGCSVILCIVKVVF